LDRRQGDRIVGCHDEQDHQRSTLLSRDIGRCAAPGHPGCLLRPPVQLGRAAEAAYPPLGNWHCMLKEVARDLRDLAGT
jgi:hypothetical protein